MTSLRSKKKHKSLSSESGMNNLDNFAPVKNILDDLYVKNPKAHKVYCQLLGKRTTAPSAGAHCCLVGHNVAVFPDDWDGELPADYNEPFTYRANLPRMLMPLNHALQKDPLTDRLAVRLEWTTKYRNMVARYRAAKDMSGYKQLTEEVARCPQHLVNMAAHVQSEPDPRFDSHFNWYYTGRGNVHPFTVDGAHYLLHSQLTCLYLTRLCEDGVTPNLDETFSFDCGEKNFILETSCSPPNPIVALRTMNKVVLLKINENKDHTFAIMKTLESKVAYTSVEFDPHHQSILYITSLDDTVDIVNLNTLQSKRVVLNEKPHFLNNWNTVQGFDRLHYVHATSQGVHVFDKRTHTKAYSIPNHRKLSEECNDITVIRKSERLPHCFYIGTNHYLFCTDVRCNKTTKPTFLTRWTHAMRCPPTYMCLNEYEVGKEAIFLSSQWPDDITVIINDTAHLNAGLPPNSTYLPYKPPNVFDSLSAARLKKMCLDPTLHIDERISTALTGLYVKENDGKFDIFTQNSLGDIAYQTLYPEHLQNFIKMEFSEELHQWTAALKVTPEKVDATDILDISAFWAFRQYSKSTEPMMNRKGKSNVNYSEDAILELFESEDFDDDLLEVWNLQ